MVCQTRIKSLRSQIPLAKVNQTANVSFDATFEGGYCL